MYRSEIPGLQAPGIKIKALIITFKRAIVQDKPLEWTEPEMFQR
jgi:hypothetical protein